jgi:hypothetical protein
MGPILGASIDFLHALLMAMWILGLPLLFWYRWPRLTRAYAVYAIGFIVANQVSHALLGECFLTTLARACWELRRGPSGPTAAYGEWFTVRMAEAIFRMTPSHRAIKLASEALIFLTAVGVGFRGVVHHRRSSSVDPRWRTEQPKHDVMPV